MMLTSRLFGGTILQRVAMSLLTTPPTSASDELVGASGPGSSSGSSYASNSEEPGQQRKITQPTGKWRACCLRWVAVATLAYLYAGDLIPGVARATTRLPGAPCWSTQQVLLLSALCGLTAILDNHASGASDAASDVATGVEGVGSLAARVSTPGVVFSAANLLPLALAAAVAWRRVMAESSDVVFCSVAGAPPCNELAAQALLNAVGLYSGKLARIDLALCLLPTAKQSLWMLVLGGGHRRLDYGGAMPLHRLAGWWCVAMSTVHSVAYAVYYLLPWRDARGGGIHGLLINCFPIPTPGHGINRLGLVNCFGVLGFLLTVALALAALRPIRRRLYNVFQRLHLPLSWMFVGSCALHDREVLLFAIPGIASWWHCRYCTAVSTTGVVAARLWTSSSGRQLESRATARLLPGTSGQWVELTINARRQQTNCPCGGASGTVSDGGRGQWLSLRAPTALGREWHPFSVAGLRRRDDDGPLVDEISLVISARQGDWSRGLAAIAAKTGEVEAAPMEVEVQGPFEAAGDWSLLDDNAACRQQLLMLAGGTGITGWLPGLQAHLASGSAVRYRLVWCVQTEADYLALCPWLPTPRSCEVVVYITRGDRVLDQDLDSHDRTRPQQCPPKLQPQRGTGTNDVTAAAAKSNYVAPGYSAAVPTLSALAGLATGFWGIHHLGRHTEYSDDWVGLASYTALTRCLPLIAMLMAVAVIEAVARRLMVALFKRRPWLVLTSEANDDEMDNAEAGKLLHSPTTYPNDMGSADPELLMEAGSRMSGSAANHEIRKGRPDLAALVAESAAEAQQHGRFLTVVACGPAELVRAARLAARSQDRAMTRNGQSPVAFAGDSPEW